MYKFVLSSQCLCLFSLDLTLSYNTHSLLSHNTVELTAKMGLIIKRNEQRKV